ncbi:hypothetical protein P171DRAFT_443932 [Karstenula rhodostoma CBS 690.94]|uniref:Uncharacterized protein n=1 Tax=Karstenula rhodostoma CBS 690.94 TaxID=1392251 RepID=A0A9P4PLC3_9PLEO|nr:hypothetical protein P171DRAFT_443932 [Karstenula rhodostoma CBS 690.94]
MGGGPKASAANLEPLGKRRRFGTPADTSSVNTRTSPVPEVRSVEDMAPASSGAIDNRSAPLLSTARTTTSYTEPEVNVTSQGSDLTQVGNPGACSLSKAEPPFLKTRVAGYVGVDNQTGPSAAAKIAKRTRDPVNSAPSPRTRLETSARALALAQEWQAKFKALPKKPPLPDSPHETDEREQIKLDRHDSQSLPAEQSEVEGYGIIATGEIDEEPRKRRRKSGPGPQASTANLEPLGNCRRGFSPKVSAYGSLNTSEHQQPSSQITLVNMPAIGVQYPNLDAALDTTGLSQSKQHMQSLSTNTVPAPDNEVLGKRLHTPVGRETVVAPKQLTSRVEDVERNVLREFKHPSPSRNDIRLATRTEKSGNHDRSDDAVRKLKRSPSPYQRRGDYKEAGHREIRGHKRDSARDNVLGRGRSPVNPRKAWSETYPYEAHPSRAPGANVDRVTHSERDRAPARYPIERQYIEDYNNRDQRGDSRLRDDRRAHRGDDFLRERSHSYRRDRSVSPRRPYHDRQSSRDHIRYRSDDRRHRGEDHLYSRNHIERRSWADYQGREYRHDTQSSYDEASRSARHERHGSDRHQSRPSAQHPRSEDRSNYRGHSMNRNAGENRDDRYRTRDVYRR